MGKGWQRRRGGSRLSKASKQALAQERWRMKWVSLREGCQKSLCKALTKEHEGAACNACEAAPQSKLHRQESAGAGAKPQCNGTPGYLRGQTVGSLQP